MVSITCNTTAVELNNRNYGWRLYFDLPPVTQLWLNQITGDMMQPQTKQSERSQTGRIKYHIQYPIYPVNQGLTINSNWKVNSDCYWWNCYLPVTQHILTQLVAYHSIFGLTGILKNVKRKTGDWYEAENENP